MRAQEGNIGIFGDPAGVFGPGKAPEITLAIIGKSGAEPNKKSFRCLEARIAPAPKGLSDSMRSPSLLIKSKSPPPS